jgi:DNA polymerase-1
MMKDGDQLIIVDGYSFVFRAYYAMPPLTRPEDGLPVGAVYGFASMLMKLISGMKPTHLVVVFDAGKKTYRNEIYPQYKATRPPAPEDLIPQFPLMREVADAFNVRVLEQEGFEADDIIATLVRMAKERKEKILIVSSDKDLMQLINHEVKMYDAIRMKLIGEKEVVEKFGVTPDKMRDLLALVGDSSDNIPGLPGIGPKTAAELLNTYHDIPTILARSSEIKQQKRRETIENGKGILDLSLKLVSLRNDLELGTELKDLKAQPIDSAKLLRFLTRQGFKSLIARVKKEFNVKDVDLNQIEEATVAQAAKTTHDSQAVVSHKARLVTAASELQEIRLKAIESGRIAIYFQNNFDRSLEIKAAADVCAVGIDCGAGVVYVLQEPFALGTPHPRHPSESWDPVLVPAKAGNQTPHENGSSGQARGKGLDPSFRWDDAGGVKRFPDTSEEFTDFISQLLADISITKIFYDYKLVLHLLGSPERDDYYDGVEDVMIMSYALGGGRGIFSFERLLEFYLEKSDEVYSETGGVTKCRGRLTELTEQEFMDYIAAKAHGLSAAQAKLVGLLHNNHKQTLYQKFDRPLSVVVYNMEKEGLELDKRLLEDLSHYFDQEIKKTALEIYKIAGQEFNIASPKQLSDVLFVQMKLGVGKQTSKSGDYRTDLEVLEQLQSSGHTIADFIIKWRQLSKLKTTYTDALLEQLNKTSGRVHTTFSLAYTSTGRFSSIDPNLQNIPIKGEYGNKIRSAFVARPGYKILSADYSQMELRLLAHIAGVKALQDAFRQEGVDIHLITAAEVFGVPLDKVTQHLRDQAKLINFSITYGVGAYGLARRLGCLKVEAAHYIKRYFQKYPEVQDYMETMKKFVHRRGYVETLAGRRCYIDMTSKESGNRAFGERAAINAPIQGTNADIIRKAMIKLHDEVLSKHKTVKMISQIHDELLFEVKNDDNLDPTVEKIQQIMANAITLSVPLKVDCRLGSSWGKAG